MMALKNLNRGARNQLLLKNPRVITPAFTAQTALAQRNYFSIVDKVKERFHKPWRHLQSFMEPDGINY